MEELALLVVCITMFVGSYLAGFVPLFFTLNERGIRLASIFGAGLLVGTALCVIIPEGVSTIYNSASYQYGHKDSLMPGAVEHAKGLQESSSHKAQLSFVQKLPGENEKKPPGMVAGDTGDKDSTKQKREKRQVFEQKVAEGTEHDHLRPHREAQNFNGPIGLSLIIGFLFMFIVDQLSKSHLAGSRSKTVPTIGLVIHAAADGIAMGSASTSGEAEMQLIVFLAIMLHKGPTAFALVSFLVLEGLEKSRVRRHLLVFSLSAPIATLLTYILIHSMESGSLSTPYVTGLILLFSAGTFLYIATAHILPELIEAKCSLSTGAGGAGRGYFSPVEVVLFIISSLFPSFISSHGHSH